MLTENELKYCVGCSACANICTVGAIKMAPDDEGFLYPNINMLLCISCGKCIKVCQVKNKPALNHTKEAYAGIHKDKDILMKSSSGGAFTAIAQAVLENHGSVFGVGSDLSHCAVHVCAESLDELKNIHGSKYMQSNIQTSYCQIKQRLESGSTVLFSGTPCQVAGLYLFLEKPYKNLITVDLICHGVPSARMFLDYKENLEKRLGGFITSYKFRHKEKKPNRYMGMVTYKKKGKLKKTPVYWLTDSYNYYFMNGDILRKSCYSCQYAVENRVADITIGDYWGVEKLHPDINKDFGVSLLLINTEKAQEWLSNIEKYINLTPTTLSNVYKNNAQLRHPTRESRIRDELFTLWHNGGYVQIDKRFKKQNRSNYSVIWRYKLLKMISPNIKSKIKKVLRKI